MSAVLVFVLLLAGPPGGDAPAPHQPKLPADAKDQARQRALELYARSLLFERDADLVQALKALEEARALDPESAALHKALTPLYLALDRQDEALAAGAKTLALDPGDHETAYLHARQLRNRKRFGDAADVLARALDRFAAKDRPDLKAQLALDLAAACDELGDPARTEKAYRQALTVLDQRDAILETGKVSEEELTALTAETWERLALACTAQKKDGDALAAFARSRKLDPERGPRLAFHQAKLHEQHGRKEQALASVEEYLKTRPRGIEAFELKARLLRALGRDGEAVAFLETAAKTDANPPALSVLLGKEYVRSGQVAAAEGLYRRVLTTHPTREIAEGLVGRLTAEPARADALLTLLDQALTKANGREDKTPDPNAAAQARALLAAVKRDAAATTKLLEALAQRLPAGNLGTETVGSLGELAERAGQLDLAERLFRAALRFGTNRDAEPEVYYGLLRVLRAGHKHQDVVDLCRQGLQRAERTNRVLFHNYLARAQLALGRVKEALESADDAVNDSGDGQRLYSRRNRAVLRAEAGKLDDAVAECQALLREHNQPGDVAEIRHALASVWSLGNQPARAEEQLVILVRDDPTNATACNDLAYQYAEQNRRLDEAERLARKAIELDRRQRAGGPEVAVDADQDNGSFVDTLGWVLFRQGKLDAAKRELARATKLPGGQDSPVIWDHLGDVLFRLDDRPGAKAAYEKALRLYELEGRRRADDAPAEIRKKLLLMQP